MADRGNSAQSPFMSLRVVLRSYERLKTNGGAPWTHIARSVRSDRSVGASRMLPGESRILPILLIEDLSPTESNPRQPAPTCANLCQEIRKGELKHRAPAHL